jgi:hypothetical protein
MLENVLLRKKAVNNSERIARSKFLTWGKKIYYQFLIWAYEKMGTYADLVFANST